LAHSSDVWGFSSSHFSFDLAQRDHPTLVRPPATTALRDAVTAITISWHYAALSPHDGQHA
jgi:hypothetical protein